MKPEMILIYGYEAAFFIALSFVLIVFSFYIHFLNSKRIDELEEKNEQMRNDIALIQMNEIKRNKFN